MTKRAQGSSKKYSKDQLRKYNIVRQSVGFRRSNKGKYITDNLETTAVDGDLLDMYSEVDTLRELPPIMHKFWLTTVLEVPKLYSRGKMIEYGWGVVKPLLIQDFLQWTKHLKFYKKKIKTPLTLKKEIRSYAESLGYLAGFTKIDRRFIADGHDPAFPFDTALVLGMEMDPDLLDEVPHPGKKLFDFEIYVKSGRLIYDVAEFIQDIGYRTHVRVPLDGFVKYVPHAVNAGLGELGAQGVLITKEYGPRLRLGMISIDADIEPDNPVDMSMQAYCNDCGICIRACPGKAITKNKVWWRGVYKHKINDTKCYPYFKKYHGCGICLKVCPMNRFGYEACMSAWQKDGTILKKRDPALITR